MILGIAALFMAQAQSAETVPPVPPTLSCDSEGHAGFDFWIGEWEVFANGTDTKVAESRIERLYRGCAVREVWMPLRGEGGTSLNHYDVVSGRWHQKWVGGAPGSVSFEGGTVDDKMVLQGYWADVGGPGRDGLTRMTYSPREDGSVRQHGEVSFDHGLTWADSFDFIYRPKGADE